MQEQQDIAAGMFNAGVHLPCTSSRRFNHLKTSSAGLLCAAIIAAAIHQQQLMAVGLHALQLRQQLRQHACFVEHRYNHGQLHGVLFRFQS